MAALSLKTPFIPSSLAPTNATKSQLKQNNNNNSNKNKNLEFGRWSCRKQGIHPEFYEDAKVYCNGELVMTTGGTQKEYNVDVWSGNHPFYLGNRSAMLVDADQVEKFRKKYGELSDLMEIPNLKGEILLPQKKRSAAAAKGKGKK